MAASVGIEVGTFLVRSSPISSWTRSPASTPYCRRRSSVDDYQRRCTAGEGVGATSAQRAENDVGREHLPVSEREMTGPSFRGEKEDVHSIASRHGGAGVPLNTDNRALDVGIQRELGTTQGTGTDSETGSKENAVMREPRKREQHRRNVRRAWPRLFPRSERSLAAASRGTSRAGISATRG
jgi:hypothetical protein